MFFSLSLHIETKNINMRSISAILFLLFLLVGDFQAFSLPAGSLPEKVRNLSGRYLNYYCSTPADSVFAICTQAENQATKQLDYTEKFLSQLLSVNAFCIKGDMGLAIDIAGRMYQDAKKMNHQFGSALALQAIGSTYMYAGQYPEADTTFAEAEKLMSETGDPLSQLNLTIQQMHTYVHLEDIPRMADYLAKAEKLIQRLPDADKPVYLFYINCYKTLYLIHTGEHQKALQSMGNVLASKPKDGIFDRWIYYLYTCYYNRTGELKKALTYSDSVLSVTLQAGNMNEYKKSLGEKATLLEKMGEDADACLIYAKINYLTDSLNSSRYSEQITALHTAYWVDKMAIENLTAHNKLFRSIILYAIAAVLGIGILIFFTLRRNSQLEKSRKKLEEMREVASDSIRSKSLFLSNMSHELRTPLNAIVGFSDILTETDDIDAETKQLCGDSIKQNSELLMKLIDDIVDFSDLNGAKIKFTVEKCDAVSLCRNVVQTVVNVKKTAAEVIFSTDLSNLTLNTDKGRLQQVLINLLINATKFTPEGTITLTLHIDPATNMATFAVEDTGCGIPPEKQARIFERFEKLHDNIQGAGLGLSICQLIVKQMGGRIWIDSEYTGGARFVFTHPLDNTSKQ